MQTFHSVLYLPWLRHLCGNCFKHLSSAAAASWVSNKQEVSRDKDHLVINVSAPSRSWYMCPFMVVDAAVLGIMGTARLNICNGRCQLFPSQSPSLTHLSLLCPHSLISKLTHCILTVYVQHYIMFYDQSPSQFPWNKSIFSVDVDS